MRLQAMVQEVGAGKLVGLLDSSDAQERLQSLQGIGPTKAQRIKRAWDKRRSLLPETVTTPEEQPSRPDSMQPPAEAVVWDNHTRCYLPEMYRAETTVVSVLARLAAQPLHEPPGTATLSGAERVERWMSTNEKATGRLRHECPMVSRCNAFIPCQRKTPASLQAEALVFACCAGIKLSEGQRAAIRMAATAPVMVLTGGPGCGKTFATATIVKLWRAMRMRSDRRSPQSFEVCLCAPTG